MLGESTRFQSGIFRSLQYPNYRLLLYGQMATSSANWMEQVSRGWLIYDMTGSPLLLGAVQASRAVPLLFFGLIGGVLADRFDRKRQLVLAQNANMVLNLILAALVITGRVEAWHVFATAILAGSVIAFQQPARQSLIPDIVGSDQLLNAIALNSGVLNATRTLGPTLAGLLIAVVGVGGSYLFQAGLFLFASTWTAQMSIPDRPERRARRHQGSMWSNLIDGLSYVRSRPTVVALLALSLVPIVLAQPYSSMVPIFAKDIFEIGAVGQGVLLSVPGIGAVIGALAVAGRWGETRQGLILIGGVVLFGVGLIAFALSPSLAFALLSLFLVGAASTSYRAVNQSLLQTNTEEAYRGRVMSIYLLDRGMAPLGSLFAGILATGLGVRDAVAILGALTIAFALVVAIRVPRLRSLE
jgi:MFS transporter, DHA1 family, staphyloferrin A biosynthesis exporter